MGWGLGYFTTTTTTTTRWISGTRIGWRFRVVQDREANDMSPHWGIVVGMRVGPLFRVMS